MTTPAGGKKIVIIAHVLNAAESTPDTVKTVTARAYEGPVSTPGTESCGTPVQWDQ